MGAYQCFSEQIDEDVREQFKEERKQSGEPMGFGYKGLVKVGGSDNYGESNQIRLSSIPKGESPICNIIYNKDGYTQHCKDFKEYETWLENRNEARYVEVKTHNQKIDGKNMMHCVRLIRMAQEIGEGKGIIVRRPDAKELLNIRHGGVNLPNLIDIAEAGIKKMDEIFANSSLPNNVESDLVNDLLIKIRKEFYYL